jgi:hypothetical protein
MELQRLGNMAFPTLCGQERDIMLKGRFFQALQVRWQRKLGGPKTDETFKELYDRARMLEQREKQYAESAAGRKEGGNKKYHKQNKPGPGKDPEVPEKPLSGTEGTFRQNRVCFKCQKTGHMSWECPQKTHRPEASARTPGATGSSRTAVLGLRSPTTAKVIPGTVLPDDLSTQQLEELLAQRKLEEEQHLMTGSTNTVTIGEGSTETKSVGPTLHLPVIVGGVPVEAFVDTGSQSTIISRSMLHSIVQYLKSRDLPLPVLKKPTVRQDGCSGGRELAITAQRQGE